MPGRSAASARADAARAGGLGVWLEALSASDPVPGGGSLAAAAAAMAAALLVGLARRSRGWREAAGLAAQASLLRDGLQALIERDEEAFAGAYAALRGEGAAGEERDRLLAERLTLAATVPLAIADRAADVALLAAVLAERGEGDLRADAVAAAELAGAASSAAAHLVQVNLATGPGDPRSTRARDLAAEASGAVARARAAGE